MELSIFSAATALIAAAALTWLVLRFFFGTQKATAANANPQQSPSRAGTPPP